MEQRLETEMKGDSKPQAESLNNCLDVHHKSHMT
jgi:hypothetical protein